MVLNAPTGDTMFKSRRLAPPDLPAPSMSVRSRFMNALRFAPQGLVLAVALPALASCAGIDAGDEGGVSEESATAVAAPGQPFSNWLQTDAPTFRGFAATHMERQLDPLLKSNQTADSALREMALITIRALREGGDKVCDDSAKIRVFRGHGFGLLPMAKTGKPLVLANYLTSDLGRFKGTDWEGVRFELSGRDHAAFAAG